MDVNFNRVGEEADSFQVLFDEDEIDNDTEKQEATQPKPIYPSIADYYKYGEAPDRLAPFSSISLDLQEVKDAYYEYAALYGPSVFYTKVDKQDLLNGIKVHLILKQRHFVPMEYWTLIKPISKLHKIKEACHHPNVLRVKNITEMYCNENEIRQLGALLSYKRMETDFLKIAFPLCPVEVINIQTDAWNFNLWNWIISQENFDPQSPSSFKVYRKQVGIINGILSGLEFLHEQVKLFHGHVCSDNVVFSLDFLDQFALPVRLTLRYIINSDNFSYKQYCAPERPVTIEWDEVEMDVGISQDIYGAGALIQNILQLQSSRIENYRSKFKPNYRPVLPHPIVRNAVELVTKMTDPDPEKRFGAIKEIEVKTNPADEEGIESLHSLSELNRALSLIKIYGKEGAEQISQNEWLQRYQFHELLGMGAFGRVFKVTEKSTGQQLALKILIGKGQRDSSCSYSSISGKSREGGRAEFKTTEDLTHKNVVLLYQHKEFENMSFIEMELCGKSLSDWNKLSRVEKTNAVKNLPVFELMILQDLFNGLSFLHNKNVLHRDLKPANVFFSYITNQTGKDAYNFPVKLGDFGLSKPFPELQQHKLVSEESANTERRLNLTARMGTPLYMAPEVWNGELYGKSADIYSLGLILLETLQEQPSKFLNRFEWFEDLVRKKNTAVVESHPLISNVKELIIGMTKLDPNERIQSMNQVSAECGGDEIILEPEDGEELEAILDSCKEDTTILLKSSVYVGTFNVKKKRITIRGEKVAGSNCFPTLTSPDSLKEKKPLLTVDCVYFTLENIELKQLKPSNPCLEVQASGSITASNLTIIGGSVGIRIATASVCNELSDIVIKGSGTAVSSAGAHCQFERINIKDCESGIFVGSNGHCNSFKSVRMKNIASTGLEIHGNECVITDTDIESLGQLAVFIFQAKECTLDRVFLRGARMSENECSEELERNPLVRIASVKGLTLRDCLFPSTFIHGFGVEAVNVDFGDYVQLEEGCKGNINLENLQADLIIVPESLEISLDSCFYKKVLRSNS